MATFIHAFLLKPSAALWVYKAVARAMLTHGCLIWHQLCDSIEIRDKLRSFQRRGLLNLGFFRKSTPTAGLELITYTKPLPLYIKEKAALSYLRTRGFEKFSDDQMFWAKDPLLNGHK